MEISEPFCITILSETFEEDVKNQYGVNIAYKSRLVASINNKIKEYQIIRSLSEIELDPDICKKDKKDNRKSLMRAIEFQLFRNTSILRGIRWPDHK